MRPECFELQASLICTIRPIAHDFSLNCCLYNVQATARGEEGMTLFFVCCNLSCGNRWREWTICVSCRGHPTHALKALTSHALEMSLWLAVFVRAQELDLSNINCSFSTLFRAMYFANLSHWYIASSLSTANLSLCLMCPATCVMRPRACCTTLLNFFPYGVMPS
jgi:hypothetical protein